MKRGGHMQHSLNSADTSSASQPTLTQPAFTLHTVLLQVAPYRFPFVIIIIFIIEDIFIAQVHSGHKYAVSAEMAVWLRNCLCNYVTVNLKKLCMQIKWRKFRNWRTTPTRRQNGGRDHNGFQPPKSKFSGYVAANVQLYRQRNRSSRCLHKVSK